MCAGTFQNLLLSIAFVATSQFSLPANDKSFVSATAAASETDSALTANKPLPQTSPGAAQKPTSAAPANSSVIRTDWKIPAADATTGDRKPAQDKVVAASAPSSSRPVPTTSRPVPAAIIVGVPSRQPETKTSQTAESVKSGAQKPVLPAAPPVSEIAQVNWTAENRSVNSRKMMQPNLAFRADCCPLVLWNPNAPGEFFSDDIIDQAPIGSCSDLAEFFAEDSAGRVFLASLGPETTGAPDAADLEELKQLLPQTQISDFSAGSYLTDLNRLLQGESSWIFGNERTLDLAQNEGSERSPGYMEDLNSLVRTQAEPASAKGQYRRTVAPQEIAPPQLALPPQRTRGERYDAIAPDQECEAVGDHGVASLFQPISSIRVTGLSTSPPEKDATATQGQSTELVRPDNTACIYMENSMPAYYFPPTRYGVNRPSRNTHILYHNPLYYEDPNLERCGQGSGCLTTAVSAVYFGTAIAFTPYLTAATCPNTCVRALPDCPTCHSFGHDAYCPGWSWKGAAAQAAVVSGLYFAVP